MQDSGIIYRGFIDAVHKLPKKKQLEAFNAYFDFLLNDKEYCGSDATIDALITMTIPSVEKARNRYIAACENGKKGGRPKNQNKTRMKPEQNQNETRIKPEANLNDNDNDNDNDNVNVNVNENENVNDNMHPSTRVCELRARARGQFGKVILTDEQLERLVKNYGEPTVNKFIGKIDRYCAKTKKTYGDFEAALTDWIEQDNGPPKNWKPEDDVNADLRKKMLDSINERWGA